MSQAVISPAERVPATLAADESNREARLRTLALPALAVALTLVASGRLNAAESSVARAIEVGPVQSGLYYGQGIVFEREGKISQALEAYKRELSLSPDQTEVVSRMAALENRALTPPKQIDGGQSAAHTPQDLSPK